MAGDKTDKQLTEPIYKVPYCIQDTIPIYRISKSGIFELEKKKADIFLIKPICLRILIFPHKMRRKRK